MRKIKVAIIDDGVNIKCAKDIKLCGNFVLVDNCVIEHNENDYNGSSHGTECAAVFCSYARNYELFSIKILNEKRTGCKYDLLAALKWCLDNGIELINLSIGSFCYQDYDEIKTIIDKLQAQGIIIVAACSNRNIRTYPASLPEVIGVRTDRTGTLLENEYVFIDKPHDGIHIVAYSKFQIHLAGGEKILFPSNSYAAPYISALVCNYMSDQEYYDITSIHQSLLVGSENKKLVDYEYMKANMPLWENKINVPIIVLLYHEEDKECCRNMIRQLTTCFRDDEYYCVSCTDDSEAVVVPYVYNLEEYSVLAGLDLCAMLLLMYNTELPDVLIICMEQNKVASLEKLYQKHGIDIVISINDIELFEKLDKEDSPCDKTILAQKEKPNPGCRFFDRTINIQDNIMELYLYMKNIYN